MFRNGRFFLNLLSIVMVLLFAVLSAFDCVEVWLEYWFDRSDYLAGDTVLIDAYGNAFPAVIVLALLEFLAIALNKPKTRILIAVFCILITVFHYVSISVAYSLRMGGLGAYFVRLTPIGYTAVGLAVANLALQIFLMLTNEKQAREIVADTGSPQKEGRKA